MAFDCPYALDPIPTRTPAQVQAFDLAERVAQDIAAWIGGGQAPTVAAAFLALASVSED